MEFTSDTNFINNQPTLWNACLHFFRNIFVIIVITNILQIFVSLPNMERVFRDTHLIGRYGVESLHELPKGQKLSKPCCKSPLQRVPRNRLSNDKFDENTVWIIRMGHLLLRSPLPFLFILMVINLDNLHGWCRIWNSRCRFYPPFRETQNKEMQVTQPIWGSKRRLMTLP